MQSASIALECPLYGGLCGRRWPADSSRNLPDSSQARVNGNQSGATGAVTVAAGATLGASSTALFEINTTARGTGYDGVNITGVSGPTYGGALSLVFGNVSGFAANTIFDLFDFTGSRSGNFTGVASTGFYTGEWIPSGDDWLFESGGQTLTFSPTTGDLVFVPEPSTLVLLSCLAVCARGCYGRRRAAIRRGP